MGFDDLTRPGDSYTAPVQGLTLQNSIICLAKCKVSRHQRCTTYDCHQMISSSCVVACELLMMVGTIRGHQTLAKLWFRILGSLSRTSDSAKGRDP